MTTMNTRRLGDDQPIESVEPTIPANIPIPDPSRKLDTTPPEPEKDSEQPQDTTLVVAAEPDSRLAEVLAENERLRKALVATDEARNHAREFLTLYGDPARLPDLEQKLYQMLPNAKQIGLAGAKLVAALAVAYRLNPFVEGMIWAYVDDHVIRVRMGYMGWLEKMHQDSQLEVLEPRPMTAEERQQHGLKPEEHGSVVEVYDLAAMQRYQKYGIPNYRPKIGIGIWRPDEKKSFVPVGRSGHWRSEIRAINDVGKRSVRFALEALAGLGEIGVAFDEENTMWTIEADPPADWTQSPEGIVKAENYLKTIGLADDEVNDALGMADWRQTWLNAQDWKDLVDAIARKNKDEAIDGTFTAPAPASQESAPATAASEAPIPVETTPDPVQPPTETAEPPVQAELFGELRPCENCHENMGSDTPFGWWCKSCADKQAAVDLKK